VPTDKMLCGVCYEEEVANVWYRKQQNKDE
jgi:hypothetical protein